MNVLSSTCETMILDQGITFNQGTMFIDVLLVHRSQRQRMSKLTFFVERLVGFVAVRQDIHQ
jgi:hypothetical protein